MNKDKLIKVESEEEFVALLRKHNLYRDNDVTFEDFEGNKFVYTGDDFRIDTEALEELELAALLIDGKLKADYLSVGDILSDYGVLCVTGNVRCKDLHYCTESTGVSVGGNLSIGNFFYANCGNSVLQVNGDLSAKVAYISQCSVDVHGEQKIKFDEDVTLADLQALGLDVSGYDDAEEAIEAHFEDLQE